MKTCSQLKHFFYSAPFLVFIAIAQANPAAKVKLSTDRVENTKHNETLVLPYVFSTEDMGSVIGLGAMATGVHQKQMSIGGTAFTGDSKAIALGLWDYRLADSERWFISAIGMVGHYPLIRAYTPVFEISTPPGGIRPGSNDSSEEDYFASEGINNWWEVKLEYVLPIGNAVDQGMATYHLAGGLLKDNPEITHWDPLTTGTTVLIARQFNRFQEYIVSDDISPEQENLSGSVHALEVGVLYDNTDFPVNPSQGSSQYFAFTYNPKWLQSKQNWNFIELEASKYFSFGAGEYTKQNILALNMWAAYSPSWEVELDEEGNSSVFNNPPFLEGATLGGMYRMRGYAQNRFHDKAALYATAEYRMTLAHNPLANIHWMKFLKLDWFQAVVYGETGRVSPSFNRKVILRDWKADAGVSLRALTAGVVVRFDVTKSTEGTSAWVMVGHPF